jgi:hypothetical protein
MPRFRCPTHSTFEPSSSMTNNCMTCGSRLGGLNPLRLLVNITFPPGSGHGPVLNTPEVLAPVGRAQVGGELLVGQSHDLARLDVNLVDVGPAARPDRDAGPLHVVEQRVIDPFAVERDVRVGDRAFAAGDEYLFGAVRAEEHEVRARVHERRVRDLRPVGAHLVPVPRGADVHDVVIEFDRLVGRDRFGGHVDRPVGGLGLRGGEGADEGAKGREGQQAGEHGGTRAGASGEMGR